MIESLSEEPAPARLNDFDELFTMGFPRTVRALMLLGLDRTASEDFAQEAFGLAHQKWNEIGGYDNPLAWVAKTASALALQHCRTSRRRAQILDRKAPVFADTSGRELTRAEQRIDLVRALEQLPRGQREVIVLHHIVDLPVAAIALTLEIAEGTVKSQLHDGRRTLASLMAETAVQQEGEGGANESGRK
ncbi:RNA polymerase sigma factor [Streptomyces sp. NPDC057694]|uniref:RNA polymerase sigma factor n=1 Tax=Streptomyces sp. NPDC057694 TaxID=3346216 RepID=UPI003699B067